MLPTPLVDLDALETIAMLVTEGLGVSLVPYWSGFEHWGHKCVVTPVGNDRYDREIALISHVQSDRPKMMSALSKVLSPTQA